MLSEEEKRGNIGPQPEEAPVELKHRVGRPPKKTTLVRQFALAQRKSQRKSCRLQRVTSQGDPDTMSKQVDEGSGDVVEEMDCGESAWEYEGNTNDSFSNGSKSTDEGFKDLPESHQNPIVTDVNILETMSHESFSKSDVVQGEEFTSKKIKEERDGVGDATEYNPTSSCGLKARGRPKGRPKGTGKTCEYCGRHFDFVSVYTVHLRTHTGERPYKCIDCDQDFAQLSNLKSHVKKHNKRCRPLKCPYCKMKFSNSKELLAHCKRKRGKGGILKCHICGKMFPFWSGLQVHIRMHTGEKPYICKVCGKAFSNRSSIRIHEVTHWSIKPYNCTRCGKSFTQLSSAKKHPCKGLRESNDREVRGEKMTSKSEFRIWKPRAPNQQRSQQPSVKKTFPSLSKLRLHTCDCAPDKAYRCPLCRKEFRMKISITSHMQTHSLSSHPFRCQECHKSFSDIFSLRDHQGSHASLKPYACPECGMVFRHRSVMEDHRRKHTEDTQGPHLCNICGKHFKYSSLLQQHQYLHTGQKPFRSEHERMENGACKDWETNRYTCPHCPA
uniref:C2H2-type domain-containing protein n=1 Tax=Oncorhynchus kisutch TaxID=8019 RepID=A0A8C7FT22_ONCKI